VRKYLTQTNRERQGSIDGLGLFFGALLGANLGTVDQLPLLDYIKLIVLLACTVMVLRLLSTSERRGYALASLAVYVVVMGAFLGVPAMRPDGFSADAAARLGATLAIWVAMVLAIEYWPTRDPESGREEAGGDPA
jgi:uncharacterized membrane protein